MAARTSTASSANTNPQTGRPKPSCPKPGAPSSTRVFCAAGWGIDARRIPQIFEARSASEVSCDSTTAFGLSNANQSAFPDSLPQPPLKHNGPLGGASGPIAFKWRLLSRDTTGGGSSRPEAPKYYLTLIFRLNIWKEKNSALETGSSLPLHTPRTG
jgi:hypothetical protein